MEFEHGLLSKVSTYLDFTVGEIGSKHIDNVLMTVNDCLIESSDIVSVGKSVEFGEFLTRLSSWEDFFAHLPNNFEQV